MLAHRCLPYLAIETHTPIACFLPCRELTPESHGRCQWHVHVVWLSLVRCDRPPLNHAACTSRSSCLSRGGFFPCSHAVGRFGPCKAFPCSSRECRSQPHTCAVELELPLIFKMALLSSYRIPLLRILISIHMVASTQHGNYNTCWQVF